MTEKQSNKLRLLEWSVLSKLGVNYSDKTIKNFELIKEWDFTKTDIPTLEKDFRFTPPWGDMVNKNQNCRFKKNNLVISSRGLEFMTTKSVDDEIPYWVGGLCTKKDSDIPPFSRIEAEVFIPQFKGQWPAFWTVDPVGTMPEFDVFEYWWPLYREKASFEGNLHWGTDYNSKKYKYDLPGEFPLGLLDKPMKVVAEFYPDETIYYINNFPFWKSGKGYSPNKKIVLLGGGTYYQGGPEGDGPWMSMRVTNLKFYKLVDSLPNNN
jgi:hypothetical protein